LLVSAGVHGGLLIWATTRPPPSSMAAAAPVAALSVTMVTLAQDTPASPLAPALSDPLPPQVRPKPAPRPVARPTKSPPLSPVREAVLPTSPAAPPLATATGTADAEPEPEQVRDTTPAEPPLITVPRFRHPPAPASYPKRAMDTNQQGTVLVRALVGTDGRPRDVRIWETSGFRLLDSAAETAVRGWNFEPAYWNGRITEAWVQVPVHFVLR